MHDFDIIKNTCAQALNGNSDNEINQTLFYKVVNPDVVLELVGLVEESITTHELETLTILIRNLINCLEATADDRENNTLPDRDDLIRQAKRVLSIYAR